jgi:hypothetical protein
MGRGGGRTPGAKNKPKKPVAPPSSSDDDDDDDDDGAHTQQHDDVCNKCGCAGSVLLCCEGDGCTRSFHLDCVGLLEVPSETWHCPHCTSGGERGDGGGGGAKTGGGGGGKRARPPPVLIVGAGGRAAASLDSVDGVALDASQAEETVIDGYRILAFRRPATTTPTAAAKAKAKAASLAASSSSSKRASPSRSTKQTPPRKRARRA